MFYTMGFGVPRLTREFDNPPTSSHNSTQELIDSAKSHGFLEPFQSVDRIRGVEVSWTLGKMVLYASSTVNSINLPTGQDVDDVDLKHMVGFGPNNDRLYSDGEFYAPSGSVVPTIPLRSSISSNRIVRSTNPRSTSLLHNDLYRNMARNRQRSTKQNTLLNDSKMVQKTKKDHGCEVEFMNDLKLEKLMRMKE